VEWVNAVCDDFEDGWRHGARPAVRDYVDRAGSAAGPEARLVLLRELLTTERELRQEDARAHDLDAYRAMFTDPRESEVIEFVLGGVAEADGARRFRVLRPHARGGLGQVFVARDEQLAREVALKKMNVRLAGDARSRARFIGEAEVTGRLEHPNIPPVYALGLDRDGQPFYAMRFIEGVSLDEAIKAFHESHAAGGDQGGRLLALRKLLGNFIAVCQAVAFAHSRGVLHRDIKPLNVMLGPFGETIVVDWGLAKVVGSPAGDPAPWIARESDRDGTEPGSALGTPSYMAPEQAAGRIDRIDQRTDVYGLGATLYQLLTGVKPFADKDEGELRRKVIAGELRPPRDVARDVPRALDAVVRKAMARDPGDRYPSAAALAEDVEHWLADEPVSAWREPLSQRARRFAARHRTALASVMAAVLAALVGLTVVVRIQSKANRSLQEANTKTEKALAQSEESRRRAEAVLGFLNDDILAAARPENDRGGLGPEVTLRRAIDAAEPRIASAFKDQPRVEADLRQTLGHSYLLMKDAKPAIGQLDRVLHLCRANLGPDHPDTLTTQCDLANAYVLDGRVGEAIRLHEQTLQAREARLGPAHTDTLVSRNSLAMAYEEGGRVVDAVAQYETADRLWRGRPDPDHPNALNCRGNLAAAYIGAGRLADAIRLLEETLALRSAKLGADHPDTLITRHALALAYKTAGRVGEAVPLFEAVLALWRRRLGPDHPDTVTCRSNLASAYSAAGRPAEAIRLQEEALALLEREYGPDDLRVLVCLRGLSTSYSIAGRNPEAIALDQRALKLLEHKLGRAHPDALTTRLSLANVHLGSGRPNEAIALLEGALGLREIQLPPDHPVLIAMISTLTASYAGVGRTADALRMHEEMVARCTAKPGSNPAETITVLQYMVVSHETVGRWADAEPLRRDSLARRRKSDKPGSPGIANELAGLAYTLTKQSKWPEAETLFRECLSIRESTAPENWQTFNTMSQLGGALLGQGRFAEASPLVVAGYEGLKARAATIPPQAGPRLPEAAARVVRLFDAAGKPAEAAAWRARVGLADLPADVFAPP
jgi:tetratricopeptide (TPR) repeat protein